MSRRFQEIRMDMDEEVRPHCPKCRSTDIGEYSTFDSMDTGGQYPRIVRQDWHRCKECENIWVKK